MKTGFGFFRDSTGNRSYGRLASFVLVLGGIILGFGGGGYGTMLSAALGFYISSKGTQAIESVWGKKATDEQNA